MSTGTAGEGNLPRATNSPDIDAIVDSVDPGRQQATRGYLDEFPEDAESPVLDDLVDAWVDDMDPRISNYEFDRAAGFAR